MARSDPLLHPTDSILGNAPSICALRDQIQHLASFDTIGNLQVPTLLLHGETGTGKGLVARVTHESGPRANGPFIEINCAAIAENLLEAELFGFEAGAFTDAKRAKPGLFEAASRGTLFLDDVDTLPIPIQAKFLKVIEEKCVRRLGSVSDQQVDVKVIAATQKDLHVQVNEGRFRDDLYHRLAVVILKIPALRERTEDIALLANHFSRSCAEAHGLVPKRLGPTGEAWLLSYQWPGNIRELSHLMVRATLLIPEPVLDAAMLERLSAGESPPSTQPGSRPLDSKSEPADESARIREALTRTGGNVVQTARLLGLGRNALRYRMRRHGIEPPSWRIHQQTMSPESEEQKAVTLSKGSGQKPDVGHEKAQSPQRGEDPATTLQENATAKLARVLTGKDEAAGARGKTAVAMAAVLLVGIVALLGWKFYSQPPFISGVATPEKDTGLFVS
ncbi:MAG: sigma-54 dependent transcriptional regulator, partial [Deltaproteobacteria bacterium]|nr:sigma-54 dependent transcriptional regulator [Deltaproteobacteria bacterium]